VTAIREARMPTESTPRPFARKLFRAILGPGDATDRELLARFVAGRDEDAFAELVRRHGPMALGVCRRVTGHPQDAEDAFQACFLVLARRAGQVKRPEQLANWIYGVAYRTALEARAARRRVQEHLVSAVPEPDVPDTRRLTPHGSPEMAELRRVIDEELAKLPDKYRAAVVLCDLEGLPRADAAARLKIPEGTLSSRLAYARRVLAERLTRRGVTGATLPGAGLTAGAVATALGREAAGTVLPRELILLTARAAVRASSGGAVPPEVVSPSVSSLADGVMKTMLVNRLRLTFGLGVLACGLLGLGALGLAQVPGQTNQQPPLPEVIRVNQPPSPDPVPPQALNAPDEFSPQQQKPAKVAAKGIEDDDVPTGATPAQAVVRLDDGKLVIRQRGGHHYQPVTTVRGDGNAVTSYQLRSGVNATTYDPADVTVFDVKGNRLATKAWKEKLKADVHCLVSFDGKLPHPRELTLFKDDTLIVVLPGHAGVAQDYGFPAPPAVAEPGNNFTTPPAVPAGQPGFPTPTTAPLPLPPQPGRPGRPGNALPPTPGAPSAPNALPGTRPAPTPRPPQPLGGNDPVPAGEPQLLPGGEPTPIGN
jgi:RNA polymerase sigma factor (sigma-70 family)